MTNLCEGRKGAVQRGLSPKAVAAAALTLEAVVNDKGQGSAGGR